MKNDIGLKHLIDEFSEDLDRLILKFLYDTNAVVANSVIINRKDIRESSINELKKELFNCVCRHVEEKSFKHIENTEIGNLIDRVKLHIFPESVISP